MELRRGDTGEDVLRVIIGRLNERHQSEGMNHIYRQWLDYQLVFQGMTKIGTDMPLDEAYYFPEKPTFLVLPKQISIGLKVICAYLWLSRSIHDLFMNYL